MQRSETLQRQYLNDYGVDVETMKSTRGTGIKQDSVRVSTIDAVGALKYATTNIRISECSICRVSGKTCSNTHVKSMKLVQNLYLLEG